MKVIKHGNKYNPRRVTCKKCDCIFTFDNKDIKTGTKDNDPPVHKWVACPECGFFAYIKEEL